MTRSFNFFYQYSNSWFLDMKSPKNPDDSHSFKVEIKLLTRLSYQSGSSGEKSSLLILVARTRFLTTLGLSHPLPHLSARVYLSFKGTPASLAMRCPSFYPSNKALNLKVNYAIKPNLTMGVKSIRLIVVPRLCRVHKGGWGKVIQETFFSLPFSPALNVFETWILGCNHLANLRKPA